MRPEALYLEDMLDAARGILRFTDGLDLDGFLGDELRQKAVLMNLIVIGEAASKVDARTRTRFPDVP